MKKVNSLSILTLCFSFILSMSLAATASAEPVVIDLGDFGGRPTVELMIGEAGPFTFVLDTGAGGVVLDESILDQIALTSIGKQMVGSPGGERFEVDRYSIDKLSISDIEILEQNAVALDMQGMRATSPIDVHGIISFWLLVESYSVLDLAGGTLTINDEKNLSFDDEGVFNFEIQPPFPYPQFLVEIGDFEALAHFDTGSPDYLTTAFSNADNLVLTGEPQFIRQGSMIGRTFDLMGATLDGEAHIGSIQLSSPEIRFIEGMRGVNIGSEFINNYLIEFDLNNELARIIEK
jgi:hypothetical protein